MHYYMTYRDTAITIIISNTMAHPKNKMPADTTNPRMSSLLGVVSTPPIGVVVTVDCGSSNAMEETALNVDGCEESTVRLGATTGEDSTGRDIVTDG